MGKRSLRSLDTSISHLAQRPFDAITYSSNRLGTLPGVPSLDVFQAGELAMNILGSIALAYLAGSGSVTNGSEVGRGRFQNRRLIA